MPMAAPMSTTTKIAKLDGGEQARVLLPPRPDIEDCPWREEDGYQQHKFQPGGDEHEDRVDDRDPREDLVAAALVRRLLIAHAAARQQHAVSGHEQIGQQRRHAGHVEHEVEGVPRPVGRDDEQRADDVGEPKRIRGHFVAILRSKQPRHIVRLARGEEHFRADEGPRQKGPEHRDQHAD